MSDGITLNGLLLGASLSYRRGEAWTVTLRLAIGAYVSTVTDVRNGEFRTSPQTGSELYSVGVEESHGAAYLYAAPEVRAGRRFGGNHWEVSAGLEVLVLSSRRPPLGATRPWCSRRPQTCPATGSAASGRRR